MARGSALVRNFLSALAFLLGALIAYAASHTIDVTFLLPFAAGNFIYIAAAELIAEIKHETSIKLNIVHFVSFVVGIAFLFAIRVAFEH